MHAQFVQIRVTTSPSLTPRHAGRHTGMVGVEASSTSGHQASDVFTAAVLIPLKSFGGWALPASAGLQPQRSEWRKDPSVTSMTVQRVFDSNGK